MEKKTKGRKRHIVTDMMGNLLGVVVHAANIHDTKSGIIVAEKVFKKYPSIKRYCGDNGYRGSFVSQLESKFSIGVKNNTSRMDKNALALGYRKRTFSWLNNSRRLSKDYEILLSSSVSIIILSHIHTLLNRL